MSDISCCLIRGIQRTIVKSVKTDRELRQDTAIRRWHTPFQTGVLHLTIAFDKNVPILLQLKRKTQNGWLTLRFVPYIN